MDVHFVGHPFFDEIAEHPLDEGFIQEWSSGQSVAGKHIVNIGMLPGSRGQEVRRNLACDGGCHARIDRGA